jgi:hypothetical protein
MKAPTRKAVLLASAVAFTLCSGIPALTMGCLHDATMYFGLPFPWLGVEVRYGPSTRQGEFFAHGPVERVEGLSVRWAMLPLELGTALALGAGAAWVMRCVASVGGAFKRPRGGGIIEPEGAANRSQPIRSETNRTSSAAGSRR